MVYARKAARSFKMAHWLGRAAIGVTVGMACAPLALGQDGQTVVSKTTRAPAPAPAAPVAPAPVAPAPVAPAPVAPAAPTQAPAANPGAPAGSWQTGVAQPPELESDIQIVAKINEYFNKLTDLQGDFLQTDPDSRRKRGKFYFQRPGKARFDYVVPADLKIISDGSYIAIEDHHAKTSEKYPLDVTPFKLLLSQNVDLAADAKIISVEQGPDTYIVTLEDKKGDASGRICLFFNKADLNITEWIISDAQGLDTRIELTNVELGKKVADNYFQYSRMLGIDRDQ